MTRLFIEDITDGIAGRGVKAAFLKCAIDDQGMTPGVERVLRAVCRAHAETGAPITVHTHPHSGTGRDAVRVLREEGADLTKVVLGHSGDSTDLDYLSELADAGCLLGMDRFGLDMITPFEDRVATVAAMCERGYARQHGAVTRRVLLHRLVPARGGPAVRAAPGTSSTCLTTFCRRFSRAASPRSRSRDAGRQSAAVFRRIRPRARRGGRSSGLANARPARLTRDRPA